MYLGRLDKKGVGILDELQGSGYVPHSPVESLKMWCEYVPYEGVYEVKHADRSRTFVKSSLLVAHPFGFDGKDAAGDHLAVYKGLAGESFYHPATFFSLSRKGDSERFGINASMPSMLTSNGRKSRMDCAARERFREKWSAFFGKWPLGIFNEDVVPIENYGLAQDGEFYYFDLHLFESIPSPLADDPRIKKA